MTRRVWGTHVYYFGECPRCGVDAPERRHPLCIDCRYVLSREEAALWVEPVRSIA